MSAATHVESVARAMRIISTLGMSPGTLSETARRVDLPKSTVARLLGTMEAEGAVERHPDDQRLFRLGPMVHRLATAGGPARLAAFAHPYLEQLTEQTGEAAAVSVPDGYATHYLTQTESPHPVQVRDWTGELIPMHLTSAGLAIMANWPAEMVEQYLNRDVASLASGSPIDPLSLLANLDAIRKRGWAWANDTYVEGINSVGAALFDDAGHVLGGIHVHGPSFRFPGVSRESKMGELVLNTANRLSSALAL